METEQWKSEVLKKTSKPNIKFFVGKVKARKRIKIIIIEYKMTVLFEVHYGILPHYHCLKILTDFDQCTMGSLRVTLHIELFFRSILATVYNSSD